MARRVSVREIYFYIVCLIALILLIIGIVSLFDNAVSYVSPASYATKQVLLPGYESQYPDLSDEEIDKLIQEEIRNSTRNERLFAVKGMVRGGIFIIIGIPLFIFHWRKAQAMWRLPAENE